ncbi:MAG: trypsin-like peptidase domain-containing protein [Victivallales bacterium]|nr:trypsin-like peptidase domain-containing protein [Victivallales bacterium]
MNSRKLFAIGAAAFAAIVSYPSIAADSPAIKAAIQVEDAFAEVVEMAKPAVVVITNKQTMRRNGFNNFQMDIPDNFFDFFGIPREYRRRDGRPQRNPQNRIPEAVSSGSGVIVRKDGYILTNFHVIKDQEYLEVKTSDGTVYDNYKDKDAVVVVGSDEESDLAVLRIGNGKKKDFTCLEFADSDKLRVGQWAIAIGAPFSLDYSVTVGCVSQKGRTDMGMSTFDSYIQTDASINPGNSGGPLLNIRGQIIGINQFIVTGGNGARGSVGIGFAIASNLAKRVSDELIDSGEVSRPFIGVTMQELSDALKEELGITYGVLIRDVIAGEPAEAAGVKPGDVVLSIGGRKVKTAHELLMEVTRYKPGDVIELQIRRGEKELKIKVKAARRDEYIASADGEQPQRRKNAQGGDNAFGKLGLRLSEADGKVVVEDVIPDGAAEKAGIGNEDKIMPGDILIEINREAVKSIADVKRIMGDFKKNTVIVYLERPSQRGGAPYKYFIALKLG